MCGIFGYVGERRDAGDLVVEGLRRLEYRGYDSWGVAAGCGGRVVTDKQIGRIGASTTSLPASCLALGHTRWATHGGVTRENAHPHLDCSGRVAVVHNGIVENAGELRRRLEGAGHRFASETDTEVIAHLVEDALAASTGEDRLAMATMVAFRLLRGLNAVAVLDVETGAIAAAKNGSPLVVGFADAGFFLASDATAFFEHTRRIAFVGDGKCVALHGRGARLFDVQSGREEAFEVTTAAWDVHDADQGAHPDYMTKEIHEQPALLERIAADESSSRALATEIESAHDAFAVGCGSGWHAALLAEYAFATSGHRVTAVPASEFVHRLAFVKPGTVVIALSQSGETIDVLEAVREAREKGARIVAVTNVEGSSLFRFADRAVLLGAGAERSVVATKSLVGKLGVVFMAARMLAGGNGANALRAASDDIRSMLAGERRQFIHSIAGAIHDRAHLYVIGRGMSYPLCLETALKIKEVSYVHAEAFPGGELKHGVIALIEQGTPCIVLAPNDGTMPDVLSAAAQVKARGALVIGISPERHAVFDHFIPVADLGDVTAIVNAVPAQLIGYDLARLRGNDPDKPRNLAKSVTVK